MKRLISTLLFIIICSISHGVVTTELSSTITQVKVGLNGAQVFRKASITILPGINTVIIDNVSPNIQNKGLQACSLGDYKIIDVKHQLKYPEPKADENTIIPVHVQQEINSLQDSLFYQNLRVSNYKSKIQTLADQKNIIKNNKLTKGDNDSLPVLKELVNYYQKELFKIEDEFMNWTIRYELLQKKITKNTLRLNELSKFSINSGQPIMIPSAIHQVAVTIFSNQKINSELEVSYLVENAGWYPAYHLRVENTDKPINFMYKGYVYQNTGEDWTKVKLSLVTFDNTLENTKPELNAWFVKYYVETAPNYLFKNKKSYSSSNVHMPTMEYSKGIPLDDDYDKEDEIEINEVEIPSHNHEALASYTFDIEHPYTIKSHGEEVLLLIKEHTVDAFYTHYLVPKITTSAYLIASIPDWENLSLLNATTNLYFEKTYLGNTNLNINTLDDTLSLSLGIDRSLFCARKKTQDSKKCRIIGSKKYQEITIEITVKNNKSNEIHLFLEDQIPVSTNPEEIEVELHQKDGASYTENNGKLKWELNLKPEEKKTFTFTYSMKYDKHKKVM